MDVDPSIDLSGLDRHNVDVNVMLRHPDALYRPSAQLAALLRGGGHVDPSMVPLMNALLAQGITTYNVCAEGSVSVFNIGIREYLALGVIAQEIPFSVIGCNFEPDGIDFVRCGGPPQDAGLAPQGREFHTSRGFLSSTTISA